MPIDDKIKDEKIQYDINREAAKISALSSGKIYMIILQAKKYCLLIEKQIIKQARFTYSPLGKAFKEQTKTIKE